MCWRGWRRMEWWNMPWFGMFMMPVMMVIFLALFLLVIIRNRAGACAPDSGRITVQHLASQHGIRNSIASADSTATKLRPRLVPPTAPQQSDRSSYVRNVGSLSTF